MASLQKNVASQNLTFCLVLASSGAAFVATSTTNISGFITKDNAAQTTVSGAFTLSGNGQYNYAPTQAETNATDIGFLFTATGVIPTNLDFHTDLTDATGNLQVDAVRINNVATTSVTTCNANFGTTQPINFTGTAGSALIKSDAIDINSIAASSVTTINANIGTTQPINFTGTAGSALVKGDAIDINSVAASSVTTINANIGTTQPINFTGTGGSAFVQADVKDWNSSAVGALPTNFSSLSIDSNGNVATTSNVKKNTASSGFMFTMTFSSNNAPATGLTVSGTVALDGGSFGSLTNSVSEISNGWYKINLAAADVNGNHVALRFAATGANDTDIEIVTQP